MGLTKSLKEWWPRLATQISNINRFTVRCGNFRHFEAKRVFSALPTPKTKARDRSPARRNPRGRGSVSGRAIVSATRVLPSEVGQS